MLHYQDYSESDTSRSESGLLTVWAALRELTEDLVLVGGLVPRYICRQGGDSLKPVTMDVDLGIALAMSTGMYETTKTRLAKQDFALEDRRFVKAIGGAKLFLDFLTDKPNENAPDSAMVDDIPVGAVYGVDRALANFREVKVTGLDLYGGHVKEHIKVCEIGPFICLKLQAYYSRAQSKDVFDFVRAVRDYDGGMEKAIAAFHEESSCNLAYDCAMQTLTERFADEKSKGPMQYVDFCAGSLASDSQADIEFLREQYANEAFDAARVLLLP